MSRNYQLQTRSGKVLGTYDTREDLDNATTEYTDKHNVGIYLGQLNDLVVTARKPKSLLEIGAKNFEETFGINPKEAASFLPFVGDAIDMYDIGEDINKGDYTAAGIGAGLLLLPNVIEKPIKQLYRGSKKLIKGVRNNPLKKLNKTSPVLNRTHKPTYKHVPVQEEIPDNWVKEVVEDPDSQGLLYVNMNSDSPIVQNSDRFYNEVMVPKAKEHGIDLPQPEQDRLLFVDPSRNSEYAEWLKGKDGIYDYGNDLSAVKVSVSPDSKVYTTKGSTLKDLENVIAHEGLSHPTDKFMTEEVIEKYNNVLRELNMEPLDINNIKRSSSATWQELRATLTELKRMTFERGIDLDSISDSELKQLLREVKSSYASVYSRQAMMYDKWNALRKGLTLPAITGILGTTYLMNSQYKNGGKLIPRKRYIK